MDSIMEDRMRARVSLIGCRSYEAAAEAVERALEPLGGIEAFVKPGQRVLLKPNLLSASGPEAAVTTHPEIVRALVGLVKAAGGMPAVGDSPGLQSARRVAERCGILAVCEEEQIELVEFDEEIQVDNKIPGPYKKLQLARAALDVPVVVNLPKLKTHVQMAMTAGVKNLFGCVVGKGKAQWHFKAGADRDLFAEALLGIYGTIAPALTILDGVVGMEGDGPAGGRPRKFGLVAAAADAVALDAVAARLAGFRIEEIPLLAAARAAGVGRTDLAEIEVLGDEIAPFDPPMARSRGQSTFWSLPRPLRRFAKRHLIPKPVIIRERCARCGRCAEACPQDAIARAERGMAIDRAKCIACFCCHEMCPERAVDVRRGPVLRALEKFCGI